MKRSLECHDRRNATCDTDYPSAGLVETYATREVTGIIQDAKPIATWVDCDSAFVNITDGLRDVIQDLVGDA